MSLPQNQTAERSALSLLLHSPECVADFKPEFFHHPSHRIIFAEIEQAATEGHPTDEIALTCRLEANGKLVLVGGPGTLSEILSTLPAANPRLIPFYRDKLVHAHVARETVQAVHDNLKDLEQMRLGPGEFSDKVASAAQGPETIERPTLKQYLDRLLADLERTEPREVFSTGLTSLDLALDGGIHRGELFVVAGETSGGKSILLTQNALPCLQAGKAVAFFSLEMPATDVLKRMAANLAGLRIKSIREKPTAREMDALSAAINSLYSMPLTIIDKLASLAAIEAEARRLIRTKKADVVIVDYVQLVENSGAETREACVAEVARKFKNLALSGQCAVLTASQLNEDGRLRESRAIGHHADIVVHISGDALVINKNRRGPRDVSIPVTLRGELGRFEE